jgi:hypothetical protein
MKSWLPAALAWFAATLGGCSTHSAATPPAAAASGDLLSFALAAGFTAGGLPVGWEPHLFETIRRRTVYDVVLDSGELALRARADSSASALRRRVSVDPLEIPFIEWSWKVERPVENADCSKESRDDCAARVLLLYRHEPSRVSLLDRARAASARAIQGETPPFAILVYAWTAARATDEPISSPHSGRVKVVPVRRGAREAGMWLTERRNHLEDFRRAFGEDPTVIESVALMTDTDDTGSTATAWYRSLRFASADPSSARGEIRPENRTER